MPSFSLEMLQDKINHEFIINRFGIENLQEIKKFKNLIKLKKHNIKLNLTKDKMMKQNMEEDRNVITMNNIIKRYISNQVLRIKSRDLSTQITINHFS